MPTMTGYARPGIALMPRTLDPDRLGDHIDRLYRAAWGLCGSREDAEDLVQETFARVLSRPRVLRGDDELYYLMRVLRNTFLTSRRTAARRPLTVATLEDVVTADAKPMGPRRPRTEPGLIEFVRSIDEPAPDSLHRSVHALIEAKTGPRAAAPSRAAAMLVRALGTGPRVAATGAALAALAVALVLSLA